MKIWMNYLAITKSGPALLAQANGQLAFTLDVINRDNFMHEQYDVLFKFDRTKLEMTLVQGGKTICM
jgi:D-alanyl-D-alanine carboxypeptidase